MAETVVRDLAKRKAARPKTVKTLRSTIKSRLRNECTEQTLDTLIEHLTRTGVLQIADGGKVNYELP
jgi:predicted transcriptional regulator